MVSMAFLSLVFDSPVYDYAKRLNLSDDVISNLLDGNYETIKLKQIGSRMVLYGKLSDDINEIIISTDVKDEETVNSIRELSYYILLWKNSHACDEGVVHLEV